MNRLDSYIDIGRVVHIEWRSYDSYLVFPFHRIEKRQKSLEIPLTASTQGNILEKRSKGPYCAWREMIRDAAQGDLFHNDDTTAKILDLVKEKNPARKGVYTTGILSMMSPPMNFGPTQQR